MNAMGGIRQLAIVTRDADAVMRHWARVLRVAPFVVIPEVVLEEFTYMGQAGPSPRIKVAVAQSRDLQIEVIEPLDDAPSIYRDYLADGRRAGMQHLSYWVDNGGDFDRAVSRMEASGLRCVQSSRMVAINLRTAYFQAPDADPDMPQFEVSELLKIPEMVGLVHTLDEMSRNWDGKSHICEINI